MKSPDRAKTIHSPEYKALLAWLRSQREAQHLTDRTVGARLEKPHSWMSKVETGERRLDVAEYVRLCRAIDAEPGRGVAVVEAALGPYKPAGPADLKAADVQTVRYKSGSGHARSKGKTPDKS